jgi:hypothetical protein
MEQQQGPSSVRPCSPGMCVRETIRLLDSTFMLHERAVGVDPGGRKTPQRLSQQPARPSQVARLRVQQMCNNVSYSLLQWPSRASFPSALPSVSLFGFHPSMCFLSVKRYL